PALHARGDAANRDDLRDRNGLRRERRPLHAAHERDRAYLHARGERRDARLRVRHGHAEGPGGREMRHADLLPVLAALVLVLAGARLGGAAFESIGQSAVLGELLAGVVLGNLGLVGVHAFDGLARLPALDLLAQLGVLFLLFQAG